MPLDGITLGAVARELNRALTGGRVDRVQQPEADEIHMTIRAGGANHRLLLSCSANFARAHVSAYAKKSPDVPPMFCTMLRKHLSGSRVLGVSQMHSDRVIHFRFEGLDELGDVAERVLIAEIMGRHSNLILVGDGRILSCARNITADISRVREVLPGLPYLPPPEQDKLDPASCSPAELTARLYALPGALLAKALLLSVKGISTQASQEIAYRIALNEDAPLARLDIAEAAEKTLTFLKALPGGEKPTLYVDAEGHPADVTSFPYLSRDAARQLARRSVSEALDEFYRKRDDLDRIRQRSASLRQLLKAALERCEKKLAIQLETKQKAESMEQMRIRGDLIMASIHQIPRGAASVRVTDYFDPDLQEVDVPLDPSLPPMDNAQRYYKQYGKLKAASKLVEGQIEQNRAEIAYLEGQLHYLENCSGLEELGEIRDELIREGYQRATSMDKRKKGAPPASVPLRYLSSEGIEIYIGKNNAQNDRLTQDAAGNDTWMHVKDVPGSHVIVRAENPGNATLSEAAKLAAHHSRAQQSGLVPVDITLRKYVKKPSGAKPGFVIYTHQRTVYVTPDPNAAKPAP